MKSKVLMTLMIIAMRLTILSPVNAETDEEYFKREETRIELEYQQGIEKINNTSTLEELNTINDTLNA